ncbi:MAG: ATP-grasp domain-containing protein [Agathobacter sp.]|nr:ATP-grasp domain-containing protein [Agathobacter sp.]
MHQEKIMVLAGSFWQIPLIKKIKESGYKVLNINPYENSPAFEYADEYRMLDILDIEACLKCAQEENVDAIMSEQCDIANPSVAYISEKLGLNSMGSYYAELYTNKLKMREFCQENGLNCPEFKICYNLQEALDFYRNLGKKIIIKPLDSNSSRGVFSIDSEEELCEHFNEALFFSRIENAVLCERYINGKEFTIDGIKTDKGHVSLAISEKYHYEHNPNIACTLFFSHKNPEYDYESLREENDKYVNLTGLPFGLTHAEYKYEDGKFYLIEIGARGGGNLIGSDIVPLMSGVDNYAYLIEKTLGHTVNESYNIDEKLLDRCAVLHFFDAPVAEGKVKEIKGLNFFESNENILKYNLNFKVGDVIKKAENDSARIGYYIAYADSREDLQALMKEIEDSLVIEIE